MSNGGYRADVDGLRAVAVLVVLFFHAGYPGFSGGFVGVDVFFVISGFLITSLIVKDLERGNFSIVTFYERRFRRILPALFVVVLLTAIVAWFVLLPLDFKKFGRSTTSLSFFYSNFHFFKKTGGYFGEAAELMPLLHTWSLAVEEQFYIFFPLFLMAAYRFLPKAIGRAVLAITVVSFSLRIYGEKYPDMSFFMLPTRGWELMLGALLVSGRRTTASALHSSRLLREVAGLVGLLAIVVAVCAHDAASLMALFPISNTLVVQILAVVGAFLVIWANEFGGGRETLSGRFLSLKPCVAIGLISYSLYLWHWPVLVLAKYMTVDGRLGLATATAMLLLSTLAAFLTYRYVEQPFRKRVIFGEPRPLFIASFGQLVVLALVGVFAVEAYAAKLRPAHFPEQALHYLEIKDEGGGEGGLDRKGFELPPESIRKRQLYVLGGVATDAPDFLLWGDSHAGMFVPIFDEMAKSFGLTGWHASYSANPPLLDTYVYKNNKRSDVRKEFNDEMFQLVKDNNIKTVVLAAFWARYSADRRDSNFNLSDDFDEKAKIFEESFEKTIEFFKKHDVTVWIVNDVPSYDYDVPHLLAKSATYSIVENVGQSIVEYNNRSSLLNAVVKKVNYNKIFVLRPGDVLCKIDRCTTSINGESLYLDSNHLSKYGIDYVKNSFLPFFTTTLAQKSKTEEKLVGINSGSEKTSL